MKFSTSDILVENKGSVVFNCSEYAVVAHSRWAIVVNAIAMQIPNKIVLIVPGFEGTHRGTDLYEV